MQWTPQTTRELLAEFIGTLMLVMVGAGAAVATGNIVAVGLAHGLALVAIAATFGHISGGYVNPAVVAALWISGHITSQKALLYTAAQFLGGIVAGIILRIVLDPTLGDLGQTIPQSTVNALDIVLIEGLLTFFLVSTIYQAVVYAKGGPATPVVVGLTLAGLIMMGGQLTGASLNPARTLGPFLTSAVIGGTARTMDVGDLLVYFLAIYGGAALAAFLHMDTFKPDDPEAEGVVGSRRLRRR